MPDTFSPTRPVAVIVPMRNEEACIQASLRKLLASMHDDDELIVVDGGSTDSSRERVKAINDKRLVLLESLPGRALQMNMGAQHSAAPLLLFHHCDSQLPQDFRVALDGLACKACWGRFDVQLDAKDFGFRVIEWFINKRSRLTGIATGDQSIFVARELFEQVGAYPRQPLMEDVELCKRLKRLAKPRYLLGPVITSARKWQDEGLIRTVLLMWRLRAQYALGTQPDVLVKRYYRGSK